MDPEIGYEMKYRGETGKKYKGCCDYLPFPHWGIEKAQSVADNQAKLGSALAIKIGRVLEIEAQYWANPAAAAAVRYQVLVGCIQRVSCQSFALCKQIDPENRVFRGAIPLAVYHVESTLGQPV